MKKGEKITYNLGISHTAFPDGEIKEYSPLIQPKEIKDEVLNWRQKTQTF